MFDEKNYQKNQIHFSIEDNLVKYLYKQYDYMVHVLLLHVPLYFILIIIVNRNSNRAIGLREAEPIWLIKESTLEHYLTISPFLLIR